MLALKEYTEPRTRRSRTPATKTKTRPANVLVAYSTVDTLDRGEPRDIETDLETIETAKALAENLRRAGYHAATYEVHSLADIDFLGKEFELDNLLVFNLCEHLNGRSQDDVKITTRMDKLGIQYTGAPTATLRRCLDKARTKKILETNSILTAPYQVFSRGDEPMHVPLPAIVKPVAEDASLGITRESVVFDEQALRARVQYVLDVYHQPALVEEYIIGREINVGLWGNGTTHTLPLAELSFASWSDPYQQFCHFEAKWVPESLEYQTMPVICPAPIEEEVAERIREAAYHAYATLGCRDYARVDMRVRDGLPYILEVNPNPCLAPDAGFPNAARVAGYDYTAMVSQIAEWAWWRRGRHD